jgi:hypothetical protein
MFNEDVASKLESGVKWLAQSILDPDPQISTFTFNRTPKYRQL